MINENSAEIIGSGPAGSACAMKLGKAGFKVKVYEEHNIIGKPIACTGIVTQKIKETTDIKKEFLINKINFAEIYSKHEKAKIKVNDFILDRFKFDQYLAKEAEDNGVQFLLNHRFKVLEKETGIIKDIRKNINKQ